MSSDLVSSGYTWTIQPKTWGKNLPPAVSHSSLVVIEPRSPNFELFGNRSSSFRLGGKQRFTCACHCAMLSGTREFNSSSLASFLAVYITPISLFPSPFFSYTKEL